MTRADLRIDLHTHSTASDGTLSPARLAETAAEYGLIAIALTDHDTVDGVGEFLSECGRLGIEGIAGVEISAEYSKEMHILGLYVDYKNAGLCEKLAMLKNSRAARNREMLRLIRENGMDITETDILSQKEGAALNSIGRAHIARAMVEKGYASDTGDAFSRFLKKGGRCYVKRVTCSPKDGIQLIKAAGGIAVLAHPVFITQDYDELYALLSKLAEYGLDGVECFYNCYTGEFSDMCCKICDRLNLLKTGGSDFHGANKPDITLGHVSAGYVPYSLLDSIKTKNNL